MRKFCLFATVLLILSVGCAYWGGTQRPRSDTEPLARGYETTKDYELLQVSEHQKGEPKNYFFDFGAGYITPYNEPKFHSGFTFNGRLTGGVTERVYVGALGGYAMHPTEEVIPIQKGEIRRIYIMPWCEYRLPLTNHLSGPSIGLGGGIGLLSAEPHIDRDLNAEYNRQNINVTQETISVPILKLGAVLRMPLSGRLFTHRRQPNSEFLIELGWEYSSGDAKTKITKPEEVIEEEGTFQFTSANIFAGFSIQF